MQYFRRVLSACCLLLLVGCTAAPGGSPLNRSPADLPPDEIAASRRFSFAIGENADPILLEAAELFAVKLGALTDGGLAVTVSPTGDAAADFLSGRAALAFLDGSSAPDPNGDFALLSGVMRYRDYTTFTMGLNSAELLATLNDRLRGDELLLLAAFYQGSAQLIADRGTVSGELRGDPIYIEADEDYPGEDIPAEYAALTAAVRPGSVIFPLLEAYGMTVSEVETLDGRIALLAGGDANVAEFSPAELESVMLPAGLSYLTTNHSMPPLWLAVKPAALGALPEEYRAAVREALTYLFPLIDGHYIDRDARIAEQLKMQGISEESRLGGLREAAALLLEAQPPADPAHQYLLKRLSSLS